MNAAGELLDVVEEEQALLAAAAACPPVGVGIVDDLDGFALGEREVVGVLRKVR